MFATGNEKRFPVMLFKRYLQKRISEMKKGHLFPGLNSVTNLTIFGSFKFKKLCDFSFNFKICKSSLPPRFFGEIYNFMLVHQQEPAGGIYKLCEFVLNFTIFRQLNAKLAMFLHFFVILII